MKSFCRKCRGRIALAEVRPGASLTCPRCQTTFQLPAEARRMGTLSVVEGAEKGEIFIFDDRVGVGRSLENEIPISDSAASRNHAEFIVRDAVFLARDRGSRNGTLVGAEKVTERALRSGDMITIGQTVFEFRCHDPAYVPSNPTPVSIFEAGSGPLATVLHVMDQAAAIQFRPAAVPLDKRPPAGLLDQYKRSYERLEMVYRVNEELSSLGEFEDVLRRILDLVFKVVPAERGVILVRDPSSGQLEVKAVRNDSARSAQGPIELSQTILSQVLEKRVSLLTSDALTDTRFDKAASIEAVGIRSAMCAPLLYQENLLGAMQVDTTVEGVRFTEDDLKMLTAIARHAAIALDNARLVKEKEREARMRGAYERYLPAGLVEQVMGGSIDLGKGGVSRTVSIMFSDIRGFTAMSERMTAPQVVEIMNEYFEVMVDVIFKYGGTLDKFIGDCIMAFWGAPVEKPDDAQNAVLCALEMQAQLEQFNLRRQAIGEVPLYMGCGINTGVAVVGNIGSTKRMEYTTLGDNVNLASRVQGLTGKGQIFITPSTYEAVRDHVRADRLGPYKVKGKAEEVFVYSVVGAIAPDVQGDRRHTGRMRMILPVRCELAGPREVDALVVDASDGGTGLVVELGPVEDVLVGARIKVALGPDAFWGSVRGVAREADPAGRTLVRVNVQLEATGDAVMAAIDRARAPEGAGGRTGPS